MIKSVASVQARLLNISKERNLDYSLLLNRLGAEQFLYRLSISPYADKFVFKGGSLLTYLLSSDEYWRTLQHRYNSATRTAIQSLFTLLLRGLKNSQ